MALRWQCFEINHWILIPVINFLAATQEIQSSIWSNLLLRFVVGHWGLPFSFFLLYFSGEISFPQFCFDMDYRLKANMYCLWNISLRGLLCSVSLVDYFHMRRKCAAINYWELFVISWHVRAHVGRKRDLTVFCVAWIATTWHWYGISNGVTSVCVCMREREFQFHLILVSYPLLFTTAWEVVIIPFGQM